MAAVAVVLHHVLHHLGSTRSQQNNDVTPPSRIAKRFVALQSGSGRYLQLVSECRFANALRITSRDASTSQLVSNFPSWS